MPMQHGSPAELVNGQAGRAALPAAARRRLAILSRCRLLCPRTTAANRPCLGFDCYCAWLWNAMPRRLPGSAPDTRCLRTGAHKGGHRLVCHAGGNGGPASHPVDPEPDEDAPSAAETGASAGDGADAAAPAALEAAEGASAPEDAAEQRESQEGQEAHREDQLVVSVQVRPSRPPAACQLSVFKCSHVRSPGPQAGACVTCL